MTERGRAWMEAAEETAAEIEHEGVVFKAAFWLVVWIMYAWRRIVFFAVWFWMAYEMKLGEVNWEWWFYAAVGLFWIDPWRPGVFRRIFRFLEWEWGWKWDGE